MKQCQNCGGTNFIEQDNTLICQDCGVKQTLAEENKVEENQTAKDSYSVYISNEIKELYEDARRARDQGDLEAANKYYYRLNEKLPYDWEPLFYHFVCAIGMIPSLSDDLVERVDAFDSCIRPLISFVNTNDRTAGEKLSIITEIVERTNSLFNSKIEMAKSTLARFANPSSNLIKNFQSLLKNTASVYRRMAFALEEFFPETTAKFVESSLKSYVECYLLLFNSWPAEMDRFSFLLSLESAEPEEIEEKIKVLDPSYTPLLLPVAIKVEEEYIAAHPYHTPYFIKQNNDLNTVQKNTVQENTSQNKFDKIATQILYAGIIAFLFYVFFC